MEKITRRQPSLYGRLSFRLTSLYTLSTGLILCAALLLVFFYLQAQKQHYDRENFLQLVNSVESKVRDSLMIGDSWLLTVEIENKCIIHIEDNGIPFVFRGGYETLTDRSVLVGKLRSASMERGINPSSYPITLNQDSTGIMTLHGQEGDTYYASVIQITSLSDFQSIFILQYIDDRGADFIERIYFTLTAVVGILLLFFISRNIIKKTLRPVEAANKKQKEFIAAASHELRSPLAVFQMNLSSLKYLSPEDSSDMAESLSDMEAEAVRMAALVEDMLLLASNDAGNWTIRKESFETDTFLLNIYESFETPAARQGLTFTLFLPEEALPDYSGDKNRLRQVLCILLDNAFYYGKSGGRIELKASLERTSRKTLLVFKVVDHGPGIAPEIRPHIFERFYRADTSRSSKSHYGLGLSIARELVQLHGGTLSCKETKHGGSTFIVELPCL